MSLLLPFVGAVSLELGNGLGARPVAGEKGGDDGDEMLEGDSEDHEEEEDSSEGVEAEKVEI